MEFFVTCESITPRQEKEIGTYVQEWLDLSTPVDNFYDQVAEDPILEPLVQAHFGLRMIKIPDLFEALCWAVIGQLINVRFAYRIKKNFVEIFGKAHQFEGKKFWLFPKPHALADLDVSDFEGLQLTRLKSQYILGIARDMANDDLSKQHLIKS